MSGEVFFFVAILLSVGFVVIFRRHVRARFSSLLLGAFLLLISLMAVRALHDAQTFFVAFILCLMSTLYFFGLYRVSEQKAAKKTETSDIDHDDH